MGCKPGEAFSGTENGTENIRFPGRNFSKIPITTC